MPGLFRHPKISIIDDIVNLEQKIYDEFQFKSPSYDSSYRFEKWDNLFLMQHYRAPTRLLDWSSSPLIGLFFALSSFNPKKHKRPSIFVLDPEEWNCGILSDIGETPKVYSTNTDIVDQYHPKHDGKSRRSEPLAIEGIINNPRINAQKGKFVVFGYQNQPMEHWAQKRNLWRSTTPITRILIKKSECAKIWKDLSHYGITYSSIFPDLDGLTTELKVKNGFMNV